MITDEAVEMAREAYLSYKGTPVMHNARDAMRAALEAAAPHMIQEAKRDGWDEGWQKAHATDDPAMAGIFFNPYRSTHGDD